MTKFIVESSVEQNPFANPRFANDGGGYSQPLITGTCGDHKWFIDDTSCGDFGSRITVGFDNYRAYRSTMEDKYRSDIPNIPELEIFLNGISDLGYKHTAQMIYDMAVDLPEGEVS